MEQRLADLLGDAFSETSVSPFLDGDFDFENLNFDLEEVKTLKEDESLHQEATGQSAVLSHMETKDINMAEDVELEQADEEDFQGVGVVSIDKTPAEDYASSDGDSEQEGSDSGDDEEDEQEDMGPGEEPGDLLMSVHCRDELCDGKKEDRRFAEGQLLTPEGAENPQVRNMEQGDCESDKEVSYFERVPERGSETMIKGDGIEDEQEKKEEKQEDSCDSECEGMKIKQEENIFSWCVEEVENPCRNDPARDSLEFPEISVQSLQDLITEVDSEEYVAKISDFSGEEHQEAGESIADYPSDFSSCEYIHDGGKGQESNRQSIEKQESGLERAVTDITWIGRAEHADEEGDEYLYSIDLEVDADKFRSLNGEKLSGKIETVEHVVGDAVLTGVVSPNDGGEISENDSYSSSDEELSDNMCLQDYENNKQLEELHVGSSASFARWSTSDNYSGEDSSDLNINWNADVLTTDTRLSKDLLTAMDPGKADTLLSDVARQPAEDVNAYLIVQREDTKTTSPSNQGSLDDSFFFNTDLKASGTTELGQLGDDECEEERNWEQEQERIKAFYEFYDDSDGENGREGRQTKVQFCPDPLSQIIRYETDSTDSDSFSSSTEAEEDLSSGETSEEIREPDDTVQMKPACDPPSTQSAENEPDLCSTQKCSREHKWNMKLILKMGLVIVMGLLMFWLATDQAGWFGPVSFF